MVARCLEGPAAGALLGQRRRLHRAQRRQPSRPDRDPPAAALVAAARAVVIEDLVPDEAGDVCGGAGPGS
jgi:hypothetical protein